MSLWELYFSVDIDNECYRTITNIIHFKTFYLKKEKKIYHKTMIFDCRSNVTGMLIRLLLERMTDSALTGCFIKQRELRGEKRVGLEPTKSKHSLSAASNVKQFSLLSLSVRWSLGCSSVRLHEFSCVYMKRERGERRRE